MKDDILPLLLKENNDMCAVVLSIDVKECTTSKYFLPIYIELLVS